MRKKSIHSPRPRYSDKCGVVLKAIRKLVYEQKLRGGVDFGFTMAQIAEEAGYARSMRFMETLNQMVGDGILEAQEWKIPGTVAPNRVVFRIASTHKQTSFAS